MTVQRLLWLPRAASILLALSAAAFAQFKPAPGRPFVVGSFPVSLAKGDFNGDAKLDLVIVNENSNNVTVLLGDGTGGFTAAPGSPFPVGTGPVSVAVGDFNKDGNLDLVIANWGSSNVTVLLGDGTGGFTAAPGSPFAVGTGPASVVAGDFDGDGNLDLAVASAETYAVPGTVTVLLGDGAGGFTAASGSPFPAGGSTGSIVVADFNRDGKLDLAFTTGGGVTLLLGDGTGGFTPAPGNPVTLVPRPAIAAVGDFNGDGIPDLAVVSVVRDFYNDLPDQLTVLLGDGTGRFTAASSSTLGAGASTTGLAVGDFNLDGNEDVVIVDFPWHEPTFFPSLVTEMLGDGTGGFTPAPGGLFPAGFGASSTAVGDFNGDGKPDLAITDLFGNCVTVLLNGSPPPVLVSPANVAIGVSLTPTLTWNASVEATSYDVYFGTQASPPLVANTTATSYAPGPLSVGELYFWRVVARYSGGTSSSTTWSFATPTVPQPVAGLRFVPVTPCRIADTRNAEGPFGGPPVAGLRSFAVPQSACGIPGTAQAYSLNVTMVPDGPVHYLTLWPAGQSQPFVSTMNSFSGLVVANAAIVPAGSGGAVSVYVSGETDVILDINGYFDTSSGSNSFSFYPATPCRTADTRGAAGQFGGPSMSAGQTRDFPISSGPCGLPATAGAFSLNVTAVPSAGFLGYLTTWPAGQAQPFVSTLNSQSGRVVANAAIVPAGSNGSISVFVTDRTDVILDSNGYFAAPGSSGALTFYPLTPCRVVDTRRDDGPFGGPQMAPATTRSFAIPAGDCSVPPTAAAYSLNVTAVPDGPLSYLTAWPTGSAQPFVSTLNSADGLTVANAAIVPAGTNGAISIFVTSTTHVILDINGYFAP